MSDLFDDLEDFVAFDDVVSGNVRDPYPELAQTARDTPIQRLETSAIPGEEGKPFFIVYRHEDIQTMLRDHETFSSKAVIQIIRRDGLPVLRPNVVNSTSFSRAAVS